MERIIGAALWLAVIVHTLPINNGFSVKFNPLNVKEDVKPKPFGILFAKVPQTLNLEAKLRRQFISKAYYPNPPEFGSGCTNQVAKVVFPVKNSSDPNVDNDKESGENLSFINLPVLKQPFENYKILLATAPPDVKISGEDGTKSLVIYVVFPEEGNGELSPINIPSIYFVSQLNGKMDGNKKEKAEPVLIIDSNRTVTGLKSREIEKFVRFKNKLTNRYGYQISR